MATGSIDIEINKSGIKKREDSKDNNLIIYSSDQMPGAAIQNQSTKKMTSDP